MMYPRLPDVCLAALLVFLQARPAAAFDVESVRDCLYAAGAEVVSLATVDTSGKLSEQALFVTRAAVHSAVEWNRLVSGSACEAVPSSGCAAGGRLRWPTVVNLAVKETSVGWETSDTRRLESRVSSLLTQELQEQSRLYPVDDRPHSAYRVALSGLSVVQPLLELKVVLEFPSHGHVPGIQSWLRTDNLVRGSVVLRDRRGEKVIAERSFRVERGPRLRGLDFGGEAAFESQIASAVRQELEAIRELMRCLPDVLPVDSSASGWVVSLEGRRGLKAGDRLVLAADRTSLATGESSDIMLATVTMVSEDQAQIQLTNGDSTACVNASCSAFLL
jgi:hypothetical protein